MERTRETIARICFLLVLAALGFIAVGISMEVMFGWFFDVQWAVFAFIAAIFLAVIRSLALREPTLPAIPAASARSAGGRWRLPKGGIRFRMSKRRSIFDFWRGGDKLPELDSLPEDQRRQLWKESYLATTRNRKLLWTWSVALAAFVGVLLIGRWFFLSRFNPGLPMIVTGMIFGGIGGATVAAIMWTVHFQVIRHRLWRRLPHLCNHCGYDLTGNTSGICPECGREIERPADAPGATVSPEGETVRAEGRK